MKIRVMHVKGKDYRYIRDTIFIAKGKTETIEKSAGPWKIGADYSKKDQDILRCMKEEEVRKRIEYWQPRVSDQDFLTYIPIARLEELRSGLYRAKKDMGPLASNLMETGFLVDFIYNSNRLEGSKIPRERIEQEVGERKKGKGEVGNTLSALMTVNTNFALSVRKIVHVQSVLMAHEPEKTGLRKQKVVVGNADVCRWELIEEELARLCDWYRSKKDVMYPVELAFDFYYKFERIHPFEDGNGRTGRLIMNRILRDHKYHPMIISWKRKAAQETAFAQRMEGRTKAFYSFMKEEFVKTHEIYIGKISSALDVERISKVFMAPSSHYEG